MHSDKSEQISASLAKLGLSDNARQPSYSPFLRLPAEILENIVLMVLSNGDDSCMLRRQLYLVSPGESQVTKISSKDVFGCYHVVSDVMNLLLTCKQFKHIIYRLFYETIDAESTHKYMPNEYPRNTELFYMLQKYDRISLMKYRLNLTESMLYYVVNFSIGITGLNNVYVLPSHFDDIRYAFSLLDKKKTPNLQYFRIRIRYLLFEGPYEQPLVDIISDAGQLLTERESDHPVMLHLSCYENILCTLIQHSQKINGFLDYLNFLEIRGNEIPETLTANASVFRNLKEFLADSYDYLQTGSYHNILFPPQRGQRQWNGLSTFRLEKVPHYYLSSRDKIAKFVSKVTDFHPEFVVCFDFDPRKFDISRCQKVSCLYLEFRSLRQAEVPSYNETIFPQLQYFACRIEEPDFIEYGYLKPFLRSNGRKLEKLHLEIYENVKFEDLYSMLSLLPNLKELYIYYNNIERVTLGEEMSSQSIEKILEFRSLVSNLRSLTLPVLFDSISFPHIKKLASIASQNLKFRLAVTKKYTASSRVPKVPELSGVSDSESSMVFTNLETFPLSPYEIFSHTGIQESSCVYMGQYNDKMVHAWQVDIPYLK